MKNGLVHSCTNWICICFVRLPISNAKLIIPLYIFFMSNSRQTLIYFHKIIFCHKTWCFDPVKPNKPRGSLALKEGFASYAKNFCFDLVLLWET